MSAKVDKPEGLLAKWKLYGIILHDDRSRMIHATTSFVILDRCRYGNARASVSYLATATGLTRGSIATATTDLVEWGYFTRRMGSGKRPTEYIPNWSIVLQPQDAASVLQPQDEVVLQPQDAKSPSVLPLPEESRLPVPLTKAVTGKEGQDLTHGGAPRPGLEAGAGAPRDPDGFDTIWAACWRKHERRKAVAAYERLNPDTDLQVTILAAVHAWTAEYERQGREKGYRKYLHNWLDGKGWLEDLPEPYRDHKAEASRKRERAAPASTSNSKPDSEADLRRPEPAEPSEYAPRLSAADFAHGAPVGRHVVTIAAATIEHVGDDEMLSLRLEGIPCGAFTHTLIVSSEDQRRQDGSQAKLGEITRALDIAPIEDVAELVGKVLIADVRGDDRRIRYEPRAANDNAAPANGEAA